MRDYVPALKRWLEPDPSQADGVRTYAYVGDDPVDETDPSGLVGCVRGGFWLFPSCSSNTGGSLEHNPIYLFLVGDDLNTLSSPNYDPGHILLKGLALVDLVSDVTLIIPVAGEGLKFGAKVSVEGAIRIASGTGEHAGEAVFLRPIEHGEKIHDLLQELRERTYLSGQEHAIVRLADGRRMLVMSGQEGGDIPGVTRLIIHTQPYTAALRGEAAVSHIDRRALGQLNQVSSWLLVHGELVKFWHWD